MRQAVAEERPDRRAAGGYSRLQIALHWSIALLVILQFAVNSGIRIDFLARLGGQFWPDRPDAWFHIASGLLILALTLLRLGVRLWLGPPAPVPGVPPVLHHVAQLAHVALYGALILMPVTGAIAWFAASEGAATLHEAGRLLFIALICGHVMGALVEHFVLGNATLMRMLRATED